MKTYSTFRRLKKFGCTDSTAQCVSVGGVIRWAARRDVNEATSPDKLLAEVRFACLLGGCDAGEQHDRILGLYGGGTVRCQLDGPDGPAAERQVELFESDEDARASFSKTCQSMRSDSRWMERKPAHQ